MVKQAKTRAAVYYGNKFNTVCRTLGITASALDAEGVASKTTCSKLNRDFKGFPVEEITRNRIIDRLIEQGDRMPVRRERLQQKGISIDDCLLPATYRLTDAACALASRLTLNHGGVFRRDGITFHQVMRLSKGDFAVLKHVEALARQIANADLYSGPIEELVDDQSEDHNLCYPVIYRSGRQEVQLTLLRNV